MKNTNLLLGIAKCGFPSSLIEHCVPYTTTELAKHVGVPADIFAPDLAFCDRAKIPLISHTTLTLAVYRLFGNWTRTSANVRFGERYQAVNADWLQSALAFLNEDWSTFTFVDLGCGKGRALIVAFENGFARVIGVEFAKSLVEIARKNSDIVGARAEVTHEDATRFEFPNGDLVVFMSNPFQGEVMRQVMNNLARHSGGKLYLLYYNPKEMAIVDERTDFLSKIGTIPTAPEFCAWRGGR